MTSSFNSSRMRPTFQRCLAALVLLTSVNCGMAADRPNILFILVDDLGWSDLGCYGHPWHRTPHIDRLASQGMRFTNAYSPAPICSAARASILTGQAVPRVGLEFVTKNQPGSQKLDPPQSLEPPPIVAYCDARTAGSPQG